MLSALRTQLPPLHRARGCELRRLSLHRRALLERLSPCLRSRMGLAGPLAACTCHECSQRASLHAGKSGCGSTSFPSRKIFVILVKLYCHAITSYEGSRSRRRRLPRRSRPDYPSWPVQYGCRRRAHGELRLACTASLRTHPLAESIAQPSHSGALLSVRARHVALSVIKIEQKDTRGAIAAARQVKRTLEKVGHDPND